MWKGEFVATSVLIFQHFPEVTKENHETVLSKYSRCRPSFELGTSRIWSSTTEHRTARFGMMSLMRKFRN